MSTAMTTDPVRYDEESGVFVVSGFDEISAVLRGRGWSSDPARNPLISGELQLPPTIILFMDQPDHTRLRRVLSPAFTPRAIETLRPRVAAIVDAALNELGDEVELMSEFSYVVPLAVIAELLDVGAEGADLLQDVTPDLVKLLEFDATTDDFAASLGASLDLTMFLTPLIVERKQRPGEDFISTLLALEDITVEEVLSTCLLLLAAGHETTANLIGNGTRAILEHPEQRANLLADPTRAVEELLRREGSIKVAARTALDDQELGGHTVPAGSVVVLELDRANADPRRFADPLRLDLSREPHGHMAFGGGVHFCLGAALARLEAAEALTGLFTRFPNMRLASDTADWRPSRTFHGLQTLGLTLG